MKRLISLRTLQIWITLIDFWNSITISLPLIYTVSSRIINNHHFDDDTRKVAYYTASPYGPLQCGKLCALEGRCVSINYHMKSHTCELVELAAGTVSDFAGWVSTSDLSFVNGKLGSCSNVNIPGLSKCVPLRNGGQTSKIKYCPAPDLSLCNTTFTSRSVGDTTTLHGTCLTNGKWSSPSWQCFQDMVKLVNGSNQHEGRVEIFHGGVWGMICTSSWDNNDAKVVCRQLGYSGGVATHGTVFGSRPGKFWLYRVGCVGNEQRLADCPSNGWDAHSNYHEYNAGAICTGN